MTATAEVAPNTVVRLAARPVGLPGPETWSINDEPVPVPAEGEVVVQTLAVSVDPAMRGWINEGRSYVPPVALGAVMRAGTVGVVTRSHAAGLQPGDHVEGMWGVCAAAAVAATAVQRFDPDGVPVERYLGMPGMTAYFGVLDVGQLRESEVLVVSAASGAVGALVGQIGKIMNCRVIGLAGGPDKCRYVMDELGFDACIDYKRDDVAAALATHAPAGIDVYFDNVGGAILEAAMARLRPRARVVICGAIAGYNDPAKTYGPRNYLNLLIQNARMEGFVVFRFRDRYAEGRAQIRRWLDAGRIKAREDVQHDLRRFPEVLNMLYKGENFGKLVLMP